ncbi:MAG: hypothetical protein O7H40_18540, partial [Gammaproteobacteria bacterium]|nr:hypothetical protein [Gammaproteobacteria bacterium]
TPGRPAGTARHEPLRSARCRQPGAVQMTPNLDTYRTANLLVKQHGEDAPIHAAMRADAMLEKGDLAGYAVWKRILRAVGDLQRTAPGARVH